MKKALMKRSLFIADILKKQPYFGNVHDAHIYASKDSSSLQEQAEFSECRHRLKSNQDQTTENAFLKNQKQEISSVFSCPSVPEKTSDYSNWENQYYIINENQFDDSFSSMKRLQDHGQKGIEGQKENLSQPIPNIQIKTDEGSAPEIFSAKIQITDKPCPAEIEDDKISKVAKQGTSESSFLLDAGKSIDKSKRRRRGFNSIQTYGLEQAFSRRVYLSKLDRIKLSHVLQLTEQQVKVWFQNRRYKLKKKLKKSSEGFYSMECCKSRCSFDVPSYIKQPNINLFFSY